MVKKVNNYQEAFDYMRRPCKTCVFRERPMNGAECRECKNLPQRKRSITEKEKKFQKWIEKRMKI